MGEEAGNPETPLLRNRSSAHSNLQRTGTIWTAMAHIITGVIGAGVLSLAWSMAQLGWIAGPILMIVFAGITLFTTSLLTDCYRSPDPEYGPIRHHSFIQAVNFYLGECSERICSIFVHESLFGAAVAYTITAAASVRAIQKSNCYHREGHEAGCEYGENKYMLIFGLIQVLVSQIPDFHNMAWLSVVAAIMSFSYALIGLGLGLAKVIENGLVMGSIGGIPAANATQKLWLCFQAFGDIAFAYPYSVILLEIQVQIQATYKQNTNKCTIIFHYTQKPKTRFFPSKIKDTLKSTPENETMKKASSSAIFVTTFFYLCCACFGYAAFGDNTPGNLLTGFGFYEPYWLVDYANACIILHLVGGYQIFSQPIFAFAERWFAEKFPESEFVNKFHAIKIPFLPPFQLNLLRVTFRTAYVVIATVIAMIFPYFNQVLGVLGAFNFWPLAIYFPVEMYCVQKNIRPWTRKWGFLQGFSIVCLLVSIMAFIGSVEGIISAKWS